MTPGLGRRQAASSLARKVCSEIAEVLRRLVCCGWRQLRSGCEDMNTRKKEVDGSQFRAHFFMSHWQRVLQMAPPAGSNASGNQNERKVMQYKIPASAEHVR